MNRKIPADAFSFYFSLGPTRSYDDVAKKYGATKRGVADHAKRERWQERIAELEERARETAEKKALESLQEMNERHLKIAKFLQGKGVEGLKTGRPELFASSTKACTAGVELERLIRGEPTERTENLEQIVRREHERWMRVVEDDAPTAKEEPPQEQETADGTPSV